MNLRQAVVQIEKAITAKEEEVRQLNIARDSIVNLSRNGSVGTLRGRRVLSLAARRRIAAAQRLRWARYKAGKQKR